MVFGSFSMVAADTAAPEGGFADMPDNWSTAALNKAVGNGLLMGYTDGDQTLIKPDNPLTRAELAAVVNRAFASTSEADISNVTDVAGTAWYAGDMAKAVKMGTFALDTKMRPDDKITRQEAFAVLARAFKLTGTDADYKALGKFTDKADIAAWALKDLDGLAAAGYVQGSAGKLNPKANITRAEFAVVMDNLVKQYIDEAGTVTEVVAAGNVMVRVAGVTLKDVTVKGDLIIADGVGEGDVTLDSVTVEGRTVVRGGGENSIIIKGNSDLGKIIVAKVDGVVRIVVEGNAGVEIIYVDDGSDDVIVEGTIGTLEVAGDNVTVTAVNAAITNGVVNGDNSKIILSQNSTIQNESVEGNASEIVVVTPPSTGGGGSKTVAVSAISVEGAVKVGESLTAKAEGQPNLTATYKWYRSDDGETYVAIDGATNKTYKLTEADEGKWIKVEVKGTGNYTGTKSKVVGPVEEVEEPIETIEATIDYNAVWNESRGTWYIKVTVPDENLDAGSVKSIHAITEAGVDLDEPRELTPDTDTVMWFGVAEADGEVTLKADGEYAYKVVRLDDSEYIFSFDYAANKVQGVEDAPVYVPMEITADLPTFVVGEPQAFTVGTVANDDTDKMVIARFTLPSGATVEYKEGGEGEWIPLVDVFGPAEGFPLGDITTTFRGTFAEAGEYKVTVSFREVGTDKVLGEKEITVAVVAAPVVSTYKFSYEVPDKITEDKEVPINVGLETDEEGDFGYDRVRFKFNAEGPGDVTFKAVDSLGNPYEAINEGVWGPEEGFAIGANYEAVTEWKLTFSAAGEYTITFELINLADDSVIVDGSETIVVSVDVDKDYIDEVIQDGVDEINTEIEDYAELSDLDKDTGLVIVSIKDGTKEVRAVGKDIIQTLVRILNEHRDKAASIFTDADNVIELTGAPVELSDIIAFVKASGLTGESGGPIEADDKISALYGQTLTGTFYQPREVFIDPAFVRTLPDEVFEDGMAEVIKYGCVFDLDLFSDLMDKASKNDGSGIETIIYRCCLIKKQIIELDSRDYGIAMLLNFGHTFGHCIEDYYPEKTYSHGEAVAIGMYMTALAGERAGLTAPNTANLLKKLLAAYNLPYQLPEDANIREISESVKHDKKRRGNTLNLVLLEKIGKGFLYQINKSEYADFIDPKN